MIQAKDEPALPKKTIERNRWTEREVNILMSMAAVFTDQGKRIRWREIARETGHHESSCALKYHSIRSRAAGRLTRELIDSDMAAKVDPVKPEPSQGPTGYSVDNTRWTADDMLLLEKLRNDGFSWTQVADRLQRSEGACATKMSDIRRGRAKVTGDQPLKTRTPWSEADIGELIRLREQEKMIWADIDKRFSRAEGSSCCKYQSLRRGNEQVSKYGSGGRIDTSEAERVRIARRALEHQTLTAALLGDPLPGFSALDKRRAGIVDEPLADRYHTRWEAREARRPGITLPTEPLR